MFKPEYFDPELLKKSFGPVLRALREEKELTLEDLAQMAGCHWKHIGELERFKKAPSFSMVLKLGCCLGLTHIEFVDLILKDIALKNGQLYTSLLDTDPQSKK